MKTPITHSLLKFLTFRGYTYCLSKTTRVEPSQVNITLKPIKYKPQLNLSSTYDTYFNIGAEPIQMADGVDNAMVWVDVDEELLLGRAGLLLKTYLQLKK